MINWHYFNNPNKSYYGGKSIHTSIDLSGVNSFLCVKPTITLGYWENYPTEVVMRVGDYDDTDVGVTYIGLDEEEGKRIFHELVNYLNDIDMQDIPDEYLLHEDWSNKGFPKIFPDLGCVRKWEM